MTDNVPRVLLVSVLVVSGCRPPEAPDDLYDVCAWLYPEHASTTPEGREVGLDSVAAWLDARGDEAGDGYEVAPLTQEAVSDLDEAPHRVDGLWGVAVATPSVHDLGDHLHALLEVEPTHLSPDQYAGYTRTWEGDLECFVQGACERVTSTEEVDIHLPLSVESHQRTIHQYVHVASPVGPAVLERAWLPEPGEFSVDWIQIPDQYYLQALLPSATGFWRLQVTWMLEEGGVVPTSAMMDQTADSMADLAAATEAWMDAPDAR